MVIPREPKLDTKSNRGLRRDYTQTPQISKYYFEDEDIVHTSRKSRNVMNKVSVLEGADGSPPF
mgnify:CR=1 FL=1